MALKFIGNSFWNSLAYISQIIPPKKISRSAKSQKKADKLANKLTLYQIYSCPYCVRVRRTIYHLNLAIELKNVKTCEKSKDELTTEGGKFQVPCLKVDNNTWIYESKEIIRYLNDNFKGNIKI